MDSSRSQRIRKIEISIFTQNSICNIVIFFLTERSKPFIPHYRVLFNLTSSLVLFLFLPPLSVAYVPPLEESSVVDASWRTTVDVSVAWECSVVSSRRLHRCCRSARKSPTVHLSLCRQAVLVRQALWCDLEQTICHCSSRVSSLSDRDLFWFQCHRLVECPDVWTFDCH